MTKFVFVSGGVISGVGKGIITASLGKILTEYGYKTTLIKADPYMNYDAGTLRPAEHGEVWVTDDGGEIDQDLGNYERFLNADIPKRNNMTSGQIYKAVIDRERAGGYLGKTISFIPHIPEEIIERIKSAASGYDIAVIEIGGTAGEDESIPFLFASKTMQRELGQKNVAHVLVTYLPIPKHIGQMKTKPTQQAIKMLRNEGIFPDFIVCRAEHEVDKGYKKKIDASVHITSENIISAPDLQTIYEVPICLHGEQFGLKVLKRLALQPKKDLDLGIWKKHVECIKNPQEKVKVAICGKYLEGGELVMTDSYLSVREALIHAGVELGIGVDITWLRAQDMEEMEELNGLDSFDGIIVPGGFGRMGVEGKIKLINHARINKIPYLGLCYGMQLACVEYARNVCGMQGAHTTEIDEGTEFPIIDLLPDQKETLAKDELGGSMRLGAYPAKLSADSKVLELYKKTGRLAADKEVLAQLSEEDSPRLTKPMFEVIKEGGNVVVERHRHRYEVNPVFVPRLEEAGLFFSGDSIRNDGTKLMEFIELMDHPFFIATQAHPEFKSRLGNPAPLFYGFIQACLK